MKHTVVEYRTLINLYTIRILDAERIEFKSGSTYVKHTVVEYRTLKNLYTIRILDAERTVNTGKGLVPKQCSDGHMHEIYTYQGDRQF